MRLLLAGSAIAIVTANVSVASAQDTFTACLQDNGQLTQGALGEQPLRECRGQGAEVKLQTRNGVTFNVRLPSDEAFINLMDHADFSLSAHCTTNGPFLLLRAKSDLISLEKRSVLGPEPNGTESSFDGIVFQPEGVTRAFSGSRQYSAFAAEFVSTSYDTYAGFRAFLTDDTPTGCVFSGEVRLVDLPELELLE